MEKGLTHEEVNLIRVPFRQQPGVLRVWLFGSRALGTHRPYSDVDLAVEGSALEHRDVLLLQSELDELSLPYAFDLIHYDTLRSETLLQHLLDHGVLLYERLEALNVP